MKSEAWRGASYSSWGRTESDTTEATQHTCVHVYACVYVCMYMCGLCECIFIVFSNVDTQLTPGSSDDLRGFLFLRGLKGYSWGSWLLGEAESKDPHTPVI